MVTRGLVLLLVVFGACTAHRFFFHNQCAHLHVWVGILGSSILEHGGFHLRPGRSHTTGVPTHWSGRIWGRTHCRNGLCQTGDCGGKIQCAGDGGYPPATLAEITLDAGNGSTHDFYHISLTDGYNLQMSMVPVGGVHAGRENTTDCTRAGCDHDLNQSCPPELQVRGIGGVIGCQSPCLAYDRDEYCCRGDYDTPKTCPPYDYSITFKKACTDAYSYALDEESSSFTCQGSRVGSSNYNITFCGYFKVKMRTWVVQSVILEATNFPRTWSSGKQSGVRGLDGVIGCQSPCLAYDREGTVAVETTTPRKPARPMTTR